MSRKPSHRASSRERGASLIEVLVAMVILMVGLLGLVGVMIESQRAQLESYQRAQALLLLQDMAARINSNRMAADCYDDAGTLGTGKDTDDIDVTACAVAVATVAQKDRATKDLQAWNDLLLGSSEKSGGNDVGAMLGARGCIAKDAATGIFQVSIAWQGTGSAGSAPAGVTCGTGLYGANDVNRRTVSITILPATTI